MKATVFGSRLSPFVEKVVRALALKQVSYVLVEPSSPSDFKRWNPQTRKMPVLEMDGERAYDSTFIIRRLEEVVPETPMFARDSQIAMRQRFLEDWSDESLYWYVMALRWTDVNCKATVEQLISSLPAPAIVRPLLRRILRRQISGQAAAQGLVRLPLERLLDELARRLDELVVLLGDRSWFFSDAVSVADLAIFGQLNTLRSGPTPQGAELMQARPALMEHFRRVDAAARPA